MSEKDSTTRLVDILGTNLTVEEFSSFVSEIVSDADRELFGSEAVDLVRNALVYPAVFAPYPDTFDSEAYAFVIDGYVAEHGLEEVEPEIIDRLLDISLEHGVVEINEDGRLFIPPEVYPSLENLLKKLE